MMEDNFKKLKKAFEKYTLENTYEITENLLKYIEERIIANKKEIEELIKIKEEKISYSELEKTIKEEINSEIIYKDYRRMCISEDKFISASMLMPIGVIAVECYETIEVIRYFIRGIKSRNAIAISDVEYEEESVKFLILEIIKEALKKFNIDENLIMILPYEECFYKYFDKVIYTYDKKGNKLIKNEYDEKIKSDNKYIFIDSSEFEKTAINDNKGLDYEILKGNIDDIIETINKTYSKIATIYTNNFQNAYKFINLVHSRNVLVNASLYNDKEVINSSEELYKYKNLIIPIPKDEVENRKEDIKENIENKELSLTVVNKSIFAKIKEILKKFFN